MIYKIALHLYILHSLNEKQNDTADYIIIIFYIIYDNINGKIYLDKIVLGISYFTIRVMSKIN